MAGPFSSSSFRNSIILKCLSLLSVQGLLTVITLQMWGLLTLELLMWDSLTVMVWVWGSLILTLRVWGSTTKKFFWGGQTVLTKATVSCRGSHYSQETCLVLNRLCLSEMFLHSYSCPQGVIITTNKLWRNCATPHRMGDQDLLPLLATSGKSFQRLCPNLSFRPMANCS